MRGYHGRDIGQVGPWGLHAELDALVDTGEYRRPGRPSSVQTAPQASYYGYDGQAFNWCQAYYMQ